MNRSRHPLSRSRSGSGLWRRWESNPRKIPGTGRSARCLLDVSCYAASAYLIGRLHQRQLEVERLLFEAHARNTRDLECWLRDTTRALRARA